MDLNDIFGSANDTMKVCIMTNRTIQVFQLPPITSSQGHCSADWRGKQIWTGFCTVILENSQVCRIQLVNSEDKTLFAESVLTDGSTYDTHVQRCYDSTRAFSLVLVSETGQKAAIGIIFPERNDSFDFIQALDEFKRAYRVEKGLDKNFAPPNISKINADLSLKEGEMITLNLKGMNSSKSSNVQVKPAGGGLKKLAPPPGSKKPVAAQVQPATNDVLSSLLAPVQTSDALSGLLFDQPQQSNSMVTQQQDLFSALGSTQFDQPPQQTRPQNNFDDLFQ